MKFKRPRCKYCNNKLYPKSRFWSRHDYLLGDIPPYCPECGKEIDNDTRERTEKYGATMFLIQCCCGISFIISLIIIILLIPNTFI